MAYADLTDLINIAIKVEKQHKQKWTAKSQLQAPTQNGVLNGVARLPQQSLISLYLKKVHSLLKTFLIIKVKMKQPLNLLELEIFNVLNVRGMGICNECINKRP